jgi:hypothetical protein
MNHGDDCEGSSRRLRRTPPPSRGTEARQIWRVMSMLVSVMSRPPLYRGQAAERHALTRTAQDALLSVARDG